MPANIRERIAHFANLLLFLLMLFYALVVAGAYFPRVPYVGLGGSMLLTRYTPWFMAVPLIIAVRNINLWRRRRAPASAVFAAVAFLTAIGASFIMSGMVAASHAHGVDTQFMDTFRVRSIDGKIIPDKIVSYGSDENGPLQLAIYLPHRAASAHPAPVLMYVHGGGWIIGSKLEHSTEMRWFADQGWLVVSVDYRLSNAQLHEWDRASGQIGCAMAWVGANASAYGGDAGHFSMTADSSGANLAINAAYDASHGSLQSACSENGPTVNSSAIPHVAAIIAEYPVLDPASFFTNTDPMFGNVVRSMAFAYTGGTPAQFPDRYAAIASRTHINPAAPPTLIIAAESDHLVSFAPALEFSKQARAAGIDVTLVQLPYAEHSFDEINGSIGNQFYRLAAVHFMEAHGQTP